MKNWKKLAVVASVSFFLGLGGGYFAYPKLKPEIKSEETIQQSLRTDDSNETNKVMGTKQDFLYYTKFLLIDKIFKRGDVNYSKLVETYKSLSLEGFTQEDFGLRCRFKNDFDVYTEVTEVFEAEKENLYVRLSACPFLDKNENIVDDKSYLELAVSNKMNIIFESVYDLNEEPHTITMRRYNPYCKGEEPFNEKELVFKKDPERQGIFHVTYSCNDRTYVRYDKDITSKKETKIIQELFDVASTKYKTARSLVLKQ